MMQIARYPGKKTERAHTEMGSRADASIRDQILGELADALPSRLVGGPAPGATVWNSEFASLLSGAGIGVLHRDLDRRILDVNEHFCTLVGRTAQELDGITVEAFTHPADVQRGIDLHRANLPEGTPYAFEKRYVRPDGTSTWCKVHVYFVQDVNGRTSSTIAIVQDISARLAAEEHYHSTVQLAPQINWTARPDGRIENVNRRWCDVTGLERERALDQNWLLALHPDDREPTIRVWRDALVSGDPVDVEYRLRTHDQQFRWFRARARLRVDESGVPVRWYGTLEDIDDRKVAETALRQSEERFRLAAQAAGLGIWDYDALKEQRTWSSEFKAMMGLPMDVRPDVPTALNLVLPEDRHLLMGLVEAVKTGRLDERFEIAVRIRRADNGEQRWMQTCGWVAQAPCGKLHRVLVTVRDTTDERTAADRVRWSANHDALTNLPNRARFNAVLESFVRAATADQQSFALIVLDVDHLKETNDTIGHDAGDLLLRTFANRLRETLPHDAVAARLGGDEFAILCHAADEAGVRTLIGETLNAIRQPVLHAGEALMCQATGGLAFFPKDGDRSEDLLKAADIALYVGKEGDKGNLHAFRSDMRNRLQRRASMFALARTALNEGRVMPYYQPKVSLCDRRIIGFESLLRWHHAHLGVQGPDTVMAAFDDYNIAVELSDAMLDRTCRDLRGWSDRGLHTGRIAVNLSPAEFRHENLAERVLTHIDRHGLTPDRFELEVTETVFLAGAAESTTAILAKLHGAGISIALDDFGTGYASLTHLKTFPVDVIKIDRSFVANLATDEGDNAIVEAVIGLARRLNMTVVAEGVETEAQAARLLQQGCSHAQGYLFGKAMRGEDVELMLQGNAAG